MVIIDDMKNSEVYSLLITAILYQIPLRTSLGDVS